MKLHGGRDHQGSSMAQAKVARDPMAGEDSREVPDADAPREQRHPTERLDLAHLLVVPGDLHAERVGDDVLDHEPTVTRTDAAR